MTCRTETTTDAVQACLIGQAELALLVVTLAVMGTMALLLVYVPLRLIELVRHL